MSGFIGPIYLANPGSTGNVTGTSVRTAPGASKIAFAFIAEVAGTTATYKVQGSIDGDQTTDANANWFDLPYITAASDTTAVAGIVRTSLGADVIWLALATTRFVRRIRTVVSANTGQTFRVEMHQQYN